jgi:hypothetical protein
MLNSLFPPLSRKTACFGFINRPEPSVVVEMACSVAQSFSSWKWRDREWESHTPSALFTGMPKRVTGPRPLPPQ